MGDANMQDVFGQLSQEQKEQLVALAKQQSQQGGTSNRGSNKRSRDRLKVLLNGSVWEALSRDCQQHLTYIEDEYYVAGSKIPYELLDVPFGSKQPHGQLPASVVRTRRHMPLGMEGRITPGMSGIKSAYENAVTYTDTVRGTRHEYRGALEKLIKELEALNKADKLEASLKLLLPGAREAFDIIDNVMDAGVYNRHIRYPPIPDDPAPEEAD